MTVPQHTAAGRSHKDLTGRRFGQWTVLAFTRFERKFGRNRAYWLCRCDCGTEKEVLGNNMTNGSSLSCGCVRLEMVSTHGLSGQPEFWIWGNMINRCHCETNKDYFRYGAKGIRVCDRWQESFEAFFEDMGPRPSSRHSVDRIDGTKGYEPGNCRWATSKEQANNRRNNKIVEFRGESHTVAEWAEILGITYSALSQRLWKGWDVERAFTTQQNGNKNE
jgi:hypothetical protein